MFTPASEEYQYRHWERGRGSFWRTELGPRGSSGGHGDGCPGDGGGEEKRGLHGN